MNPRRPDDEFDRAARALHRSAVARVSPGVRQRLRDARGRTAVTAPRPRPRPAWPLAGALAAVLVLAVAVPLRSPAPLADAATTISDAGNPRAAGATPSVEPTEPTALAALDESPDFYLWLASADATSDGALP